MAPTLQQERKLKKANGQGEGKGSRKKCRPRGRANNVQDPVSSEPSHAPKGKGTPRALKWSQSGKEGSKRGDANLDTTQGVHIDEQVWLSLSKKTRQSIQAATAEKQNKRKVTADLADMAINSNKRSAYKDDVLSLSAKFSSTNIVPPVVKANELP